MKVEFRKKKNNTVFLGDTLGGDCFIWQGTLLIASDETKSCKVICIDPDNGELYRLDEETEVVLEQMKVVPDED